MKKHNNQNPPIKGYLPIRVILPPIDDKERAFTTFIYLKEHNIKKSDGAKSSNSREDGSTLFVANAPSNGPIRTDLFLRALFQRYGEVARVTVAQDPRKVGSSMDDNVAVEIFREAALSTLGMPTASSNPRGDGKFAHVVFSSGKEMRKAMKSIKREISEANGEGDLFSIQLDDETLEQLKMETKKLISEIDNDDEEEGDDGEDIDKESNDSLTGIQATAAEARRKAGRHVSRQKLMQMCNDAMAAFESEEAEAGRKAKMAADEPDEDGFVTVTRGSTSFGAANDFEEERHGGHHRKNKRNRKRKAGSGAAELSDFYRFQMKESRKKEVHDLRQRFEEDLAKVKKMKEEKVYRPF